MRYAAWSMSQNRTFCAGCTAHPRDCGPRGIGNFRNCGTSTLHRVISRGEVHDARRRRDKGIVPKAGYVHYTVRQAARDWLAIGLDGRSPKTIKKNQNVLEPILKVIGARKLRELTAADVRQALSTMAAGYSTAAVTMGHLALKRAIRHAEANDLVSRNVATLADTPKGRQGRPSKSLTLEQAVAVIAAAKTLPVMELRPGLKDVRRPAVPVIRHCTAAARSQSLGPQPPLTAGNRGEPSPGRAAWGNWPGAIPTPRPGQLNSR